MIRTQCHKGRVGTLAVLLALLFSLQAAAALAQGNIRLGRTQVDLGLKYELRYVDNIYYESANEEEDFIHIVTPSVDFAYNGSSPDNYFKTGYSVALAAYSDFDQNNYQSHHPYLDLSLKTPVGFYFKIYDGFLYTQDPYGSRNSYNLGVKTKRMDNTADVALGYEFFNKYSVEALYRNYFIDYDLKEDEWQNRMDNRYGGAFYYHYSPKTFFLVEYRFTQAEYDKQNDDLFDYSRGANWSASKSQDYTKNDVFVGAKFNPGGKLGGAIRVGWGSKDYDNKTDILGKPYKDMDGWISETAFYWQALARTLWIVELGRSFEGSPDADAAGYIDTYFKLSLRQGMANRLTGLLGFEYNNNDYENEAAGRPKKEFDIYGVTAGLEYEIQKWLTTSLQWEYQTKEASDGLYPTQEYDRNVVKFVIDSKF
ncbi:MAG: outer membrane beta-barrel protein [Desulfobacterales bacterium]|nr:outer membrane beta-barrel protein [Desulfobacterales bacterium]